LKKIKLVNPMEIPDQDPIVRFIRKRFTVIDDPFGCEMVLVLGGDGSMLKAIRTYQECGTIFTGLNYGHIGFLMNTACIETLQEILQNQLSVISVNILQADLYDARGKILGKEYAFNDFYFERSTQHTAKIRIWVNGKIRFDPLMGDGVIICTSAGSTAYNASAGGVIMPIGTNSMVLTGISPAVFHYWRTALLAAGSRVTLEPVETDKRPVRFLGDGLVKPGVARAEISYSDRIVRIAFARSGDFREKVLNLQFNTP
jgi:NAD+ kinase